jgi:hypothetical protein
MTTAQQIAKHLREVHFGGNWTAVNLKDTLKDVDYQQATAKIYNLNTIAALTFHMNYYVSAVLKVLKGELLTASDKLSFNVDEISSEEQWQNLVKKVMDEAEVFASEIEKLEDAKLSETLADPKYGNYFRNLDGIVEHTHYHLGQIVLIKKILSQKN